MEAIEHSGELCLTIHASQELSDDSSFHLSLSILSFWGDGIDLIDEEDTRCVSLHSTRISAGSIWSKRNGKLTAASSKVSLSCFSDSPDIPETIEGAEMEMKGIPSSC